MLLSVAIRQRIIYLTHSNHISLKELSRRSNVPYSTLINFMSGKGKTLNITTLYHLCIGLDISLLNFFDSPLFIDIFDEHEKETKKLTN